jgi:hypothetical protein
MGKKKGSSSEGLGSTTVRRPRRAEASAAALPCLASAARPRRSRPVQGVPAANAAPAVYGSSAVVLGGGAVPALQGRGAVPLCRPWLRRLRAPSLVEFSLHGKRAQALLVDTAGASCRREAELVLKFPAPELDGGV